jgi:hypothetical protein
MPKFRVYVLTTYRTVHSIEAANEDDAAAQVINSDSLYDEDVVDVEPEDVVIDFVEEEG